MRYYHLMIDVTDTVTVAFTTGIQRVVKEFATRMIARDEEIALLRFNEEALCFDVLDNEAALKKMNGECDDILVKKQLSIKEIGRNDCFLDLDSVWNSYKLRRQNLYQILKKQGAKIGTLVHDVIPISFPQFCHADTVFHFLPYLSAVLEYSDFLFVTTEATRQKIQQLARQVDLEQKKIYVVPLGADFRETGSHAELAAVSRKTRDVVAKGRYLLMVGTIEPRKNHQILLDAFDQQLKDTELNIVIAGRVGWNVDALMQRIITHPAYERRIFFLEGPSDADIQFLYCNAFAVVFASFEEGFGLPIIEAFHYKKLVFSSNVSVLKEVGGPYAEYFDPEDVTSLCQLIHTYLLDSEKYNKKIEQLDECRALSWDECTNLLLSALQQEQVGVLNAEVMDDHE